MKRKNSESTTPTPATKQLLIRLALLVGAAVIVLVLVSIIFQQFKSKSYARLAPMAVSIELSYSNQLVPQNEVILEYDYGYGFISAHRQSQVIETDREPKVLEFSISSWKPVRGLRVSVATAQGVNPNAITFTKLDESTRILLNSMESTVLLHTEDVASLFPTTPISSSEEKVNAQ